MNMIFSFMQDPIQKAETNNLYGFTFFSIKDYEIYNEGTPFMSLNNF